MLRRLQYLMGNINSIGMDEMELKIWGIGMFVDFLQNWIKGSREHWQCSSWAPLKSINSQVVLLKGKNCESID
jgi:hypothetical protein